MIDKTQLEQTVGADSLETAADCSNCTNWARPALLRALLCSNWARPAQTPNGCALSRDFSPVQSAASRRHAPTGLDQGKHPVSAVRAHSPLGIAPTGGDQPLLIQAKEPPSSPGLKGYRAMPSFVHGWWLIAKRPYHPECPRCLACPGAPAHPDSQKEKTRADA